MHDATSMGRDAWSQTPLSQRVNFEPRRSDGFGLDRGWAKTDVPVSEMGLSIQTAQEGEGEVSNTPLADFLLMGKLPPDRIVSDRTIREAQR